jgi:hypothetical protein
MLRVVVISALIAVAIAAPTWTGQLAAATEQLAETTSLAERHTYGVECHKDEMPISFVSHSMPQAKDFNSSDYTWAGFGYTTPFNTTLVTHEQCKRGCLDHNQSQSSCKAYWWQQRLEHDSHNVSWLHRHEGLCYTTTQFEPPYENTTTFHHVYNSTDPEGNIIFHSATEEDYLRVTWGSSEADDAERGAPVLHGSLWCYITENPWDDEEKHSTEAFDGKYQENCHCTACHFEYKDSAHEEKKDITSCAQECSGDSECQTVLHDSHKKKCFYYKRWENSHGTMVPDLGKNSTYNNHTDVHNTHRNEFTCWYKCDKDSAECNSTTVAPTTLTPVLTTPAPATLVTPAPVQTTNLDKWDSSTKGSTISLSNGDRTMTTTTSNAHTWNSVYGTFTVSGSGKHTWIVNITTLDNGTPNYWELGIGVANTTTMGNSVFFAPFTSGVAYIQETGGVTSANSVSDGSVDYGEPYYLGDLISIEIDFDSDPKTITAYKNGISQGVMSNDVEGTYRLACMAGDELDSVEIVGYTSS